MKFNWALALLFTLIIGKVNIANGTEFVNTIAEECPQPLIEPRGTLFICGSQAVTLFAPSGFSSYQWIKNDKQISGANSESLDVTEAGFYKVLVKSGASCEMTSEPSEVKEVINDDLLPFDNLISTNGVKTETGFKFCEGESIEISVLGNFSGYVWTGGENNHTPTVTISEPGNYKIAARVSKDCALTRTVNVSTYPAPVVEIAVPDSIFMPGEAVSLVASGGSEFSWFPTEGLSNPNIANPIASPDRTITYTVTGINLNGCNSTASITLVLDNNRIDLFPPKVFSANRDEFYIIENIENYPQCELIIFNRLGLEVFKAKPYLNNWNGQFKGGPLPKGDYYFVMRGEGNKNLKTGSILLLR